MDVYLLMMYNYPARICSSMEMAEQQRKELNEAEELDEDSDAVEIEKVRLDSRKDIFE